MIFHYFTQLIQLHGGFIYNDLRSVLESSIVTEYTTELHRAFNAILNA
jgi:hypothetical protein